MEKIVRSSIVSGRIRAPPSQAYAHRAILASSLGQGQSVLSNLPQTPDVLATISACRALGADIVADGDVADIFGAEELFSQSSVNCGSNTSLKLLLALAGSTGRKVEFRGGGRLASKSFDAHLAYCGRLGASVESKAGLLPFSLQGPFTETGIVYFPSLGTQFFSGLLFSSPLREEPVQIGVEGVFANRRYIDMTLNLMERCEVFVRTTGRSFPSIRTRAIPRSGSSTFLQARICHRFCFWLALLRARWHCKALPRTQPPNRSFPRQAPLLLIGVKARLKYRQAWILAPGSKYQPWANSFRTPYYQARCALAKPKSPASRRLAGGRKKGCGFSCESFRKWGLKARSKTARWFSQGAA